MEIYFFNIETGQYKGAGEALENPVNPGNPHIPVYATTTEPPEYGENEMPYWNRKTFEWEIRPYYIGKKQFDLINKVVTYVDYEGAIKEGFIYIDEETAQKFEETPDKFTVVDDRLVELTESEYLKHQAQREKELRSEEIKTELKKLDAEAIRPLRASIAGIATEEDVEKLKDIERQALSYRIELQNL